MLDDIVESENLDVTAISSLNCTNEIAADFRIINNSVVTEDDVVKKFSLNEEQEKAFRIFVNENDDEQKVVYCGFVFSYYFEKKQLEKEIIYWSLHRHSRL